MKFIIKRHSSPESTIKVDELPDYISKVFELYNSACSLEQIKTFKFTSKDEFNSLDTLDVTYFLTREKLLKLISTSNPEILIDVSTASDLEKSYLKTFFNDLTDDDKISINLDENFNDVSNNYINYILYIVVSMNKKIKDINTVYHFIDNHYESRFSDLILKYDLNNHYREIILQDINPVVLHEYELKMMEIPPIESVLKMDSESIESYYKMVWNNSNIENPNNFNLQLIRSPKATEWMIKNFLIKNDITFIYNEVLPHPSCPLSILESLIGVEDYLEFILINPKVDNSFLEKVRETNYIYNDIIKVYKVLLTHPKCSEELSKLINSDLDIIHQKKPITENCTPNIKQIVNKEEVPNTAVDDFHVNLIKDYVKSHNIREILDFSNYANTYFKNSSIHELIEVKIANSSVDDMTTIIETLAHHDDEELNNALKLTIIERLENLTNNKEDSIKINNVLSGTKFFTKKEKESLEHSLIKKIA